MRWSNLLFSFIRGDDMKKFWSFLTVLIFCGLFVLGFTYREDIVNYVMKSVIQNKEVTLPSEKSNYNNYEFAFVQETDDFHVKSKQGILNAIYTILNHGMDNFTFYCDSNYDSCLDDLNSISQDQVLLSTINNFVSPFNSYEKIYFKITSYGEINISIDKLYTNEEITEVNSKIAEFEKSNIKDEMSVRDKIKTFHDYLINNSIYDKERADLIEKGQDTGEGVSHKATGPLLHGIALCSGYSDAMKIYLDKLGIPNYKISNTNHIWNLIYIDGKWLHLDLTWDDPVTSDGSNILLDKFFLITNSELQKLDPIGHKFDSKYYPEAINS